MLVLIAGNDWKMHSFGLKKKQKTNFLPQGGHLAKIPHQAQRNNHVLGVNLELSALQSDI